MKIWKCILIMLLVLLLPVSFVSAEVLPPEKAAGLQAFLDDGDYMSAFAMYDSVGTPEALAEKEQLQASLYARAADALGEKDFNTAAVIFAQLGDYSNASELAYYASNRSPAAIFMVIGIPVSFGRYIQSGNEPEPLHWTVLAREENRVLLFADQVIDCWPYHNCTVQRLTWANSFTRKKLNSDFLTAAFTPEEQSCLVPDTDGDLVSLPASEMLRACLPDASSRKCGASDYAVKNGVWLNCNHYCYYMLKDVSSPAKNLVRYVSLSGGISSYAAKSRTRGIRPVIWVDLDKLGSTVQ